MQKAKFCLLLCEGKGVSRKFSLHLSLALESFLSLIHYYLIQFFVNFNIPCEVQ